MNGAANTLAAFSISTTGALTALGAALATGVTPISLSIDPSGRFAYVANRGSSTVSSFSINPSTGLLSANGPALATGTSPRSISVDFGGNFVYVANATSNTVSRFRINPVTGILSSLGAATSSGGTAPFGIITTGTIQ